MAAENDAKGAMNSSFEIFNTPSRGRGIKTKVSLNKGNSVLSCEPYAFVSRNEKLGKICDSCLSVGDGDFKRCSGCKMVYYCGQTCQKKAWQTHKLECKYLKKMSPIMPSDTVRLLVLILLKNDGKNAEWLNELVAHSKEISKGKGEVFAYMLEMLRKYLGGSMPWSSGSIFELFCKVNCNAFTICDEELRPIGLGLYETIAFLNHSCEPNCIAVFMGHTSHIRSIRDVEPGQELCISYTELLRPQSVRGKVLREQYYFDCTCSRCVQELEHGSVMNGLTCAKKECSNPVGFNPDSVQDTTCSECGSHVPQNYKSPSITQLYLKIETSLSTIDKTTHKFRDERQSLRDLLKQGLDLLHPHNYQVLKIVDKLSDLCIESSEWQDALAYCRRSLEGYQKLYPQFHPSTSLQLYRTGKLEVFLNMKDSGISTLAQAKLQLEVCYGKRHPLTIQLSELIFQTAQERNSGEGQRRPMLEQQ